MDTTTRRKQNDVVLPDKLECYNRCGTPTTKDDPRTKSLFGDSVFYTLACAMWGVSE